MEAIVRKTVAATLMLSIGAFASTGGMAQEATKRDPLVIQEQGSFAVGGQVVTAPGAVPGGERPVTLCAPSVQAA